MELIAVSLTDLLTYREAKNLELFAAEIEKNKVKLAIQATPGMILYTHVYSNSYEWQMLKNFVNKPIRMYDRRIVTHNFADPTTWLMYSDPYVTSSKFSIIPDPYFKFIIFQVNVRFPQNAKLTPNNAMNFKVYLTTTGVPITPQSPPVIALTYNNMREMLRKADTPFYMTPDVITTSEYTHKICEITFQYADPATGVGAPLVLHWQFNERIDIYLAGDNPVLDESDQPLGDDCFVTLVCKRTLDF